MKEISYEYAVNKMSAILFRPQCVKSDNLNRFSFVQPDEADDIRRLNHHNIRFRRSRSTDDSGKCLVQFSISQISSYTGRAMGCETV